MTYYLYLAFGAFLFTLLGTRLVIRALRNNPLFLDRPNERSNHIIPTPRGGGLAVVFSLIIFFLAGDASYWLIIGLAFLACVSLLDDMISLSPLTRLLIQLFTVYIVQEDAHFTLFGELLPVWLDQALVIIVWVWFINLFNFMDGIDGISATEMISIGIGIGLVLAFDAAFTESNPLALYSLLLVTVGSGFLWWNWHPAKIFLGDVGSVPIGFIIGYLLLTFWQQGFIAASLILPAYYVADSTFTLFKRMLRGEKFWRAHSEHFYQRAVRAGRSHRVVVENIFGVNMLLICISVFAVINPELAAFEVVLAYITVGALMFHFSRPVKSSERL